MPASDRFLDLQALGLRVAFTYERLLAESLRGFLSELCMVSAATFLSYIEDEKANNIDDIVASSAELTLRPGLLRYAHRASVDDAWGFPPEVSINLELRHASLAAFFRVVFEAQAVGVRLDGILFREAVGAPEENLRRFARALEDSRLARQ